MDRFYAAACFLDRQFVDGRACRQAFHQENRVCAYGVFFFFQAEDGIRDYKVTGVQTCALPICAAADDYTVPVAGFEEQLDWLASHGFHTVSLHDLAEWRQRRETLPDKAIILTFDDGKADALGIVLPALRKRGMRATFFVITHLVGRAGYLTLDGVRALADAGMEIGSHTGAHPRLPDPPHARGESGGVEPKRNLHGEVH